MKTHQPETIVKEKPQKNEIFEPKTGFSAIHFGAELGSEISEREFAAKTEKSSLVQRMIVKPVACRLSLSKKNVNIFYGQGSQKSFETRVFKSEMASLAPSRVSTSNRNLSPLNFAKNEGKLGLEKRSDLQFLKSVGFVSQIQTPETRSPNLKRKRSSFYSPVPAHKRRVSQFPLQREKTQGSVSRLSFLRSMRGFGNANLDFPVSSQRTFDLGKDLSSLCASTRMHSLFGHLQRKESQNSISVVSKDGIKRVKTDSRQNSFRDLRVLQNQDPRSQLNLSSTTSHNIFSNETLGSFSREKNSMSNFPIKKEFNCDEMSVSRISPYFLPFSYTSASLYNNLRITSISKMASKLFYLRKLCGALFLFEKPDPLLIQNLSNLERGVLLKIIEKKQYNNIQKLKSCLSRESRPNVMIFRRMSQVRRREMQIKYTFRAVTKFLKFEFEKKILSKYTAMDRTSKEDKVTLFYLYYFGEQLYERNFEKLIFDFYSDPNFRQQAEEEVKRFYFPDMKNQRRSKKSKRAGPPSFKSFNRFFFQSISKCEKLFRKINNAILRTLPYLMDCGERLDSTKFRNQADCGDDVAMNILFYMVDNNNREISKVFTEWYNLCKPKGEEEVGEREILDRIFKNVDKNNFKFPWSVTEARKAFFETFMIINDGTHFKRTKGKLILKKFFLDYYFWG